MRGLAIAVVIVCLVIAPPMTAADQADEPCCEQVAPADDFQSRGIGLTAPELAALYGPGESQDGVITIYDFNGFDLVKDGCDLILEFPPSGPGGEQVHAFAVAESLLPDDAAYAGALTLGAMAGSHQDASVWRSPSLAARFARLGEHRGDEIVILYTYEQSGNTLGPATRAKLWTVQTPE